MMSYESRSVENTISTLLAAIKKCGKRGDLQRGKILHTYAVEARCHTNKYISNALINMYSKCRSVRDAKVVFDNMSYPDVVSWTNLILGYVENGESHIALELFTNMECKPDRVTFMAALKACIGMCCLEKGMALHKTARDSGLDTDVLVATNLVEMYSKCGIMRYARDVFDHMPHRNVVTWTTVILGYVENGESFIAIELLRAVDCEPNSVTFVAVLKACTKLCCLEMGMAIHRHIRELGFEKDMLVGTSLVEMYRRCGSMQDARYVFDGLAHRDVVCWRTLVFGYVENGESSVALEVFASMGCAPDCVTFIGVVKALTELSSLEKGMALHKYVKELGLDTDVFLASSLLEMYGRCSSMQDARFVFEIVAYPDVVAWSTLIMGYVENGESQVAIELFITMSSEPNYVTFSGVIKACGCLAWLETGKRIHARICRLGLEHKQALINSLVDFYGNCGNVAAGEHLFNEINVRNIVSWNALIAGYTCAGETYRVFSLVRNMRESGLRMDQITFTLLMKACNHAGMVDEGRKYLESMCVYGIRPSVEHYNCMVDMLCRAYMLNEALTFVNHMPHEVNEITWTSLIKNNIN